MTDKSLHSFESLLNRRHARRVAESDVIISPKSDAGHRRYFFGFQQPCAKLCRFEPRSPNVRKQIKSALHVHTGNPTDPIDPFPGKRAAFVKLRQPALEMVL